jgi:hypothetical protein
MLGTLQYDRIETEPFWGYAGVTFADVDGHNLRFCRQIIIKGIC